MRFKETYVKQLYRESISVALRAQKIKVIPRDVAITAYAFHA